MLDVRNEGRITPIEPLPGKPVHRAWDIGVKDDTSIWWFQVVGLQVLILDCYSSAGAGVDHYAEQIGQRRETHGWMDGIDYVPHDAAHRIFGLPGAKTTIDQMLNFGLHPELVPSLSKLDGINAARKTLARCVFDPRCEEFGISALEQYRREWDDDKKTFRANEVHDWASHPADAFRYLSIAWRSAPRETEQPKARQQSGTVLLDGPPKPRKRSAMKV
jgi:hypothetical protein